MLHDATNRQCGWPIPVAGSEYKVAIHGWGTYSYVHTGITPQSHPRFRDLDLRGSFQPVPGTRYGPSALTTPEADEAWTPMTCRRRRREPGLAAAACVHGAAALTTSQPDIQLTTFMETMAFTAWREATSPWGLPCLDQAHLVELEDRWPASARGVGAVMTS